MSSGCCPLGRRNWRWTRGGCCGVLLTHLQGADVGDDGPTILHRNLRRIRRHGAPAVCYCVEEVAHRRLSQAVVIKRRRTAEAATHDHPIAVSSQTMTDAAKNVVAFLAAEHDLLGNWKWKSIDVVRISVCLRASG